MGGYGKQKGADFERSICVHLSLWFSKGAREDLFWRTAMSGGRFSVGLKSGIVRAAQAGDVGLIDAMGAPFIELFSVECKSYKNLEITRAVFGAKTAALLQFWEQTTHDAEAARKLPLLVAKQNNRPVILGCNSIWFRRRFMNFPGRMQLNSCVLAELVQAQLLLLDYGLFFSMVSPDYLCPTAGPANETADNV